MDNLKLMKLRLITTEKMLRVIKCFNRGKTVRGVLPVSSLTSDTKTPPTISGLVFARIPNTLFLTCAPPEVLNPSFIFTPSEMKSTNGLVATTMVVTTTHK